jgi:hypothetical protein
VSGDFSAACNLDDVVLPIVDRHKMSKDDDFGEIFGGEFRTICFVFCLFVDFFVSLFSRCSEPARRR